MNEDGDIVVTLSIDPPVESAPAVPVEVPPTPVDVDASVEITEVNN